MVADGQRLYPKPSAVWAEDGKVMSTIFKRSDPTCSFRGKEPEAQLELLELLRDEWNLNSRLIEHLTGETIRYMYNLGLEVHVRFVEHRGFRNGTKRGKSVPIQQRSGRGQD